MGSHMWKAVSAIVVGVMMSPAITAADMWKCTQPDGSVVFSDGGGAGCREVNALPELQSARTPTAQAPIAPQPKIESVTPVLPKKVTQPLSSSYFVATSRMVPNLYYKQYSRKGWSWPNKGDVALVQIDVSFWPSGNGPYLEADHHFKNTPRQAFSTAFL